MYDADVRMLAVLLILAGALQLFSGIVALRRKGDFKTTQGRQLAAAFGPRGTVAFFLLLGTILLGAGLWCLSR